jgi:hypothetical protein
MYKNSIRKLKGNESLGDLDVDGKLTLQYSMPIFKRGGGCELHILDQDTEN